jgi:hypothetical protein
LKQDLKSIKSIILKQQQELAVERENSSRARDAAMAKIDELAKSAKTAATFNIPVPPPVAAHLSEDSKVADAGPEWHAVDKMYYVLKDGQPGETKTIELREFSQELADASDPNVAKLKNDLIFFADQQPDELADVEALRKALKAHADAEKLKAAQGDPSTPKADAKKTGKDDF